jgi:hypothetical protein
MSIATNLEKLETDITNAYSAINTKGGTIPSDKNTNNLSTAISSIPSGGGDVVIEKDVNFYDYDGTLVDSYTNSEFANLSELPNNPTHEGLTAQGWNWTLSGAKTYVDTYGKLDIGQNYVTSDGKTRLYVEIQEYKKHVYVGFGINGSATIDWGDNTTSTLSGTSTSTVVYAEHTYSQSGDYVIAIQSSATINIFGTISVGSYLFTGKYTAVNQNRGTLNSVKKIELGSNITIGTYAFAFMPSLETITMPSVSTIGTQALYYCNSLKFCVIPKGITSVSNSLFQNDDTLEGVSLSETCSKIGNNAFYECRKLKRITIASGTTSLGSSAFQNCSSLEEIIVSNTVTSLGSNCFNGCRVLEFTIPSTVTLLGTDLFSSNYKVKGFVVPSSVHTIPTNCFTTCVSAAYFKFLGNITNIAASAFFQDASVEFYDFTNCTRVPTLSNTNAFTGINYSKIVVPDSLYDSWIAASNWSNYASKIIKESDWNAS